MVYVPKIVIENKSGYLTAEELEDISYCWLPTFQDESEKLRAKQKPLGTSNDQSSLNQAEYPAQACHGNP